MSPKITKHVDQRLRREAVIWLTTVRPDGTPQPTPVWFLWDGETFLIYSKPNGLKLRNIANNSKVALSLNCDESGSEVVVITGDASIDRSPPPTSLQPAYLRKYRKGIEEIQLTPESMAKEYSVAIWVKPTHIRQD